MLLSVLVTSGGLSMGKEGSLETIRTLVSPEGQTELCARRILSVLGSGSRLSFLGGGLRYTL